MRRRSLLGDRWFGSPLRGDEVDLKEFVDEEDGDEKALAWEQQQGVVKRSDRKTLALSRARLAMTKRRAPGPGPIKTTDRRPIANRFPTEDKSSSTLME